MMGKISVDLTTCVELQPLDVAVRMHTLAERQGLDGANRLARYEYTRKVCNGIGAEWFPGWLRWLVGVLAPALEPTAWIHDLDYEAGGGVIERWMADWDFLRNGLRAARATYAWDQLRRYTTIGAVLRFWLLLRLGGAAAFNWHRELAEGL